MRWALPARAYHPTNPAHLSIQLHARPSTTFPAAPVHAYAPLLARPLNEISAYAHAPIILRILAIDQGLTSILSTFLCSLCYPGPTLYPLRFPHSLVLSFTLLQTLRFTPTLFPSLAISSTLLNIKHFTCRSQILLPLLRRPLCRQVHGVRVPHQPEPWVWRQGDHWQATLARRVLRVQVVCDATRR